MAAPSKAQPSAKVATKTPSSSPAPKQRPLAGNCLEGEDKTDLRQVPCDQRHGFEIIYAKKDDTHVGHAPKRVAYIRSVCNREAAAYLGSASFLVTYLTVEVVPDNANPQDDLACMVAQNNTITQQPQARTSSLRDILSTRKGFLAHRWCLVNKASSDKRFEVTSCDQPHSAEAVDAKLIGKPGDDYPGDATIKKDAEAFCRPKAKEFIGATRSDVTWAQNSSQEANWDKGSMVTGCFLEIKDEKTSVFTGGVVTSGTDGLPRPPCAPQHSRFSNLCETFCEPIWLVTLE